MNDDNPLVIIILLVVALGVTISFTQGFNMGEKSARKETISYCVEKPADCKIKYDYYKLENQK